MLITRIRFVSIQRFQAASVIGLSDKVIMAAHEFMKSDKVKDRLRATTQEALDRGVLTAFFR